MSTSIIHSKHDKILSINQEQVNKFYQERQLSKRQMNNTSVNNQQRSQNTLLTESSFKNLYRRKSLMHKVKEDDSMFTSFNNSVDFDRSLAQSLVKKSRAAYHGNTSHEQNIFNYINDEKAQNFQPNQSSSQNHSSLQQHRQSFFYDTNQSSSSIMNRLKKRSNSVQLQTSSSMSVSGVRQSRGTVPLSTILKKYQQEVNKLQIQNSTNNDNESNFMSFSKMESPKKMVTKFQENNKENFDTFNPHAQEKQDKQIMMKGENKLPQTVEKCIDKWRDLQIEQLKAERLYNKRKDIAKIDSLNNEASNKFQSHKQKSNEETKNNQINLLKEQYQQKLKEKDEYINYLQKQNNQYKKFVLSMQKMKNTLEQFQPDQSKSKEKGSKSKNTHPNNQPQVNLKQLWRWIKSLPNKKNSSTKKQSVR